MAFSVGVEISGVVRLGGDGLISEFHRFVQSLIGAGAKPGKIIFRLGILWMGG